MMRSIRAMMWLCAAALTLTCAAAGHAQTPADDEADRQFLADVQALTAHDHRLPTTPESRAATDYITQRLRDIGITSIYNLDSSAAQMRVQTCQIEIAGQTIELSPMRPNVIMPPTTPAEGYTGRYIYVGKGALTDYEDRHPRGAIVGLDYNSGENWRHAFRLGAHAVVFIGQEDAADVKPKHASVPANLVRLYADGEAHGDVLRRNHDQATVTSHLRWETGTSRNLLALIPGVDPRIDTDRQGPEIIVLSCHYDSYGEAPYASPGARSAANVAALLQIAEHLQNARPKRHVLLAFFDNHAQQRQGARVVYRVLSGDDKQAAQFAEDHRRESRFVDRALELLRDDDWLQRFVDHQIGNVPNATPEQLQVLDTDADAIQRELKLRADHIDADIKTEFLPLRMERSELLRLQRAETITPDQQRRFDRVLAEIQQLDDRTARVDAVRQALAEARSAEDYRDMPARLMQAAPDTMVQLRERLLEVYETRREELDREIAADESAERIRERLQLGPGDNRARIALHVHLNLSDLGRRWGVVAGDSTTERLISGRRDADQPSHYTGVLRAFRAVIEEQGAPEHLDVGTVEQPTDGQRFVSGVYANDGLIAGLYGIYNVTLMTGSDARLRDGHPIDTLENLNWQRIARFSREAGPLLAGVIDTPALPTTSSLRAIVKNSFRVWHEDNRRASGNYGLYRVTGGLKEDRAARGAVMAIWSRVQLYGWAILEDPLPANFALFAMEPVDAYGLFDMVSYPKAWGNHPACVFGAIFDKYGLTEAASNAETFEQNHLESARIEIIPARDFAISYPLLGKSNQVTDPFKMLGSVTNSTYPADRQHVGQSADMGFAFISQRVLRTGASRLKVFTEHGPVILGLNDLDDEQQVQQLGRGVPPDALMPPPNVQEPTADDLWMLSEMRLQTMRSGGIASAALERLHIKAKRDIERAEAISNVHAQAVSYTDAAQRERRNYQPIRDAMNDLVRAVVFLLLLAIPFAFAVERLLIGANTIYGRLGGFVAVYTITFALLYVLHPGFGVAAVPLIILLAFIIILLGSMVIYILLRKFNTELREMQGQSSKAHEAQISRTGTLVAAANMGISTMRRRPLRTALTALTVVLLTFTILCFASVGSAPGVKRIYLGSAGSAQDADLMLRAPDYSKLPPELPEVLEGRQGPRGLIAEQWWLSRQDPEAPPINITRATDGQTQYVQAVWGISPAELTRWPDMAESLRRDGQPVDPADIGPRDVFLPPVVRDQLHLAVGDELLVEGVQARFAGIVLTSNLQRLKHIDGEPAMPVNFQDTSVLAALDEQKTLDEEAAAEVQRSFARLSPNQIAIVPIELIQPMRGDLRIVRIYLDPDLKTETVGHELTEIMPTPVWSRGTSGAERLVFASLIEVQAGQALLVPLLLGGLIVFGTMLGSISDREKEIYTFSALGLAPSHVGLLFFAEAAVYAVVGGMAGQILAQLVALATSSMHEAGWITPPEFNFSSTNALFAIFIVMATVMISALYPAMRASKSANPGLARSWKLPPPEGDDLNLIFPFTVSAYDITGVVSYLAEHFRVHDDAGVGGFAASNVKIERHEDGNLSLSAEVALAPFDLGVTQVFRLTATASEIPGVDEVAIHCHRLSGTHGDWNRTNKVFIRALRKQFLLWRTLSDDAIESYRMRTLMELGERQDETERGDDHDTTSTEATR